MLVFLVKSYGRYVFLDFARTRKDGTSKLPMSFLVLLGTRQNNFVIIVDMMVK
jgi:hypothetical protein